MLCHLQNLIFCVCLGMSEGLWRLLITDYTLFKRCFQVPGLDEGVAHLPLQPPISNCLNQITPNSFYNITTKNWHKIPPQWKVVQKSIRHGPQDGSVVSASGCTRADACSLGQPANLTVGCLLQSWSSAMWKGSRVGDVGTQCPGVLALLDFATCLSGAPEWMPGVCACLFSLWKREGIL